MFGWMKRSSLAAVALMAMGAATGPVIMAGPPITTQAPAKAAKPARRQERSARSASSWYGRKGAGISMATQKRTAAKRRNVARNRRAHR